MLWVSLAVHRSLGLFSCKELCELQEHVTCHFPSACKSTGRQVTMLTLEHRTMGAAEEGSRGSSGSFSWFGSVSFLCSPALSNSFHCLGLLFSCFLPFTASHQNLRVRFSVVMWWPRKESRAYSIEVFVIELISLISGMVDMKKKKRDYFLSKFEDHLSMSDSFCPSFDDFI